jgi:hypothetical protein
LAVALFGVLAAPCRAETLYLANGEVVRGRIVRIDDQTLSVESEKGYGTLQINKADIVLIEYDAKKREPARSLGIGYFVRTVPPAVNPGASEYGVDALSLKYWLSSYDSADLQVGFFSARTGSEAVLEVFSVDLRYAQVVQRRASLDIYWGVSAGYLSVKDNTLGAGIDAAGTRMRAFLGAEVFLATLPGLGISAEIGMGSQTVGSQTIINLSTATFPTFAVRYYF